MAHTETVTITGPDGKQSPGEAGDVQRISNGTRITVGWLYIIGGFVGGTACIVIPIVHLFTTWGLPLLGVIMGVRTFKRRVETFDIVGMCPVCNQHIELRGGSVDDPAWQKCPECDAVLTVQAKDAPVADPVQQH